MITNRHRELLNRNALTGPEVLELVALAGCLVGAIDSLAGVQPQRPRPSRPRRAQAAAMPLPAGEPTAVVSERLAAILVALDGLAPSELLAVALRVRSRLEYAA